MEPDSREHLSDARAPEMKRVSEGNLNTLEYWNDRFARNDYFDWDTANLPQLIADLIPQNARVLDVGTGAAIFPRRISNLRPDIVFSACDFSPVAIQSLQVVPHSLFQSLFVWDVREPCPFGNLCYDTVLATELLEHLEKPEVAVRNMVNVAKRQLIVTVPNENRIESGEHLWSYTAKDLYDLLRPYGMANVNVVRWEGFNLLADLQKF